MNTSSQPTITTIGMKKKEKTKLKKSIFNERKLFPNSGWTDRGVFPKNMDLIYFIK